MLSCTKRISTLSMTQRSFDMTMMIDEIEKTNRGRFRKLLLSMFAIGGGLYVQFASGQPITWPVMALVFGVALSFNSSDTLEKMIEKLGDSEIAQKIKAKIPGGK